MGEERKAERKAHFDAKRDERVQRRADARDKYRAGHEAANAKFKDARAERLQKAPVSFVRTTYLGGFADAPRKKTGSLIFETEAVGVGTGHPKSPKFEPSSILSIEVTGSQVAKSKVGAEIAFGVLGGLGAKGSMNESVVVIRTKNGEAGYFQIEKISAQEVLAKLAPWMNAHDVPLHEDHVRTQDAEHHAKLIGEAVAAASPAASGADELLKLAELHRSGVLTDDEFAAAKARALA